MIMLLVKLVLWFSYQEKKYSTFKSTIVEFSVKGIDVSELS